MKERKIAEEIIEHAIKEKIFAPLDMMNDLAKGEKGVLGFLLFYGVAITSGNLSKELDVSTARIAFILNSLENKELIKRDIDKDDKRKTWISLTKKGNDVVRQEREKIIKIIILIIKEVGQDKFYEHIELIKQIKNIIKREHEKEI